MSEQARGDTPELPDEGLETSSIVPLFDLDREIARRARHQKGLADDEQIVNFQDKETRRKAKIVGSAAAILVASGLLAGYFAAHQYRKKKH